MIIIIRHQLKGVFSHSSCRYFSPSWSLLLSSGNTEGLHDWRQIIFLNYAILFFFWLLGLYYKFVRILVLLWWFFCPQIPLKHCQTNCFSDIVNFLSNIKTFPLSSKLQRELTIRTSSDYQAGDKGSNCLKADKSPHHALGSLGQHLYCCKNWHNLVLKIQ